MQSGRIEAEESQLGPVPGELLSDTSDLSSLAIFRQISKVAEDLTMFKESAPRVNVLMIGTGEYTTGYVQSTGSASQSDKGAGVVALTMLDLSLRGKVGRIGLCGVNGKKLPAIRKHLQRVIGDVYEGLRPELIETFPADHLVDERAYLKVILIPSVPMSQFC